MVNWLIVKCGQLEHYILMLEKARLSKVLFAWRVLFVQIFKWMSAAAVLCVCIIMILLGGNEVMLVCIIIIIMV